MVLYLHRYTWLVIRPELAKEYGYTNTELEQILPSFKCLTLWGRFQPELSATFSEPEYFSGDRV